MSTRPVPSQDLHWLPAGFLALFKTALDIPWRDHILMQASFQKHVHASISKTINMPCSATKEDCEEALLMAWKLGLKGITIYRTGSRDDVVLALKNKSPAVLSPAGPVMAASGMRAGPEKIPSLSIDRPKELAGRTYLCQSGCCRLYVTVNLMEGKPMEVFIRTVGSGGCDANSSALGRAISTGLQNGVPYQKFVKQFAKVNCISAIKNPSSEGHSCADVVGRCIELSAKNQSIATLNDWDIKKTGEQRLCPECHNPLDFGEGCNQGICKHCGWTGCSDLAVPSFSAPYINFYESFIRTVFRNLGAAILLMPSITPIGPPAGRTCLHGILGLCHANAPCKY